MFNCCKLAKYHYNLLVSSVMVSYKPYLIDNVMPSYNFIPLNVSETNLYEQIPSILLLATICFSKKKITRHTYTQLSLKKTTLMD